MKRSSKLIAALLLGATTFAAHAAHARLATPVVLAAPRPPSSPAQTDLDLLRAHLLQAYPSLPYVDRYREAFPDEIQGGAAFWSADPASPDFDKPEHLVAGLAQLQDQHVALVGPRAGKAETLGVLFRSATDGSLVAWRVFADAARSAGLHAGDRVLMVDGVETSAWLRRSAALTFGGNRRGRMAEAALDLGMGTPIVHRTAQLHEAVSLTIDYADGKARTVDLSYQPMSDTLVAAMAIAVAQADLPEHFEAAGLRIGTLRVGAFAPQYDPMFVSASDKASETPGTSEDRAMLAGYCAVVADFVRRAEALAKGSDVFLLDLRGNLGGFDREARLLAQALAAKPIPPTFDWFATASRDTAKLTEEIVDPSCGHISLQRPIVVLDDGGTRSAGEFMASWLWEAGAIVVGETTAGAFEPSRSRPFAIQSLGLRPDLAMATTLADLREGGVAQVKAAVATLRADKRLP